MGIVNELRITFYVFLGNCSIFVNYAPMAEILSYFKLSSNLNPIQLGETRKQPRGEAGPQNIAVVDSRVVGA